MKSCGWMRGGLARVRPFYTSLDAGALDLHLTASNADMGSTTPVVSAISSCSEITAGLSGTTLYSSSTATSNGTTTTINLPPQGVSTLFMPDCAASPSGALRRER